MPEAAGIPSPRPPNLMDYAIIEKIMELSASTAQLDAKLKDAARLFTGKFGFDQCVIYLWDDKPRTFHMKAYDGAPASVVVSYNDGEGLAGFAASRGGKAVSAVKDSLKGSTWEGVTDNGLDGYKSAIVYALRDRARLTGVLYLKSRRKRPVAPGMMALLNAAATGIVLILRFDELYKKHRHEHDELRGVQASLVRAEKLVSLADMAAMLAHEIKNPLLSAGGHANKLKKHLGRDSEAFPYVEQMISELQRVEKIVNGAVRVIQNNALELEPGDVNGMLAEILGFFDEELRMHGIKVVKEFHEGKLTVMADSEQIKIAFDNLIANAIQSMENGGTLSITTGIDGEWVTARVADTGGGIDPQHMDLIFNPFFTTKEHGTGLGLPITKSIILKHHGSLELMNKAGEGAVFFVKLPYVGHGGAK